MYVKDFMIGSAAEAIQTMTKKYGGPFGAAVVKMEGLLLSALILFLRIMIQLPMLKSMLFEKHVRC